MVEQLDPHPLGTGAVEPAPDKPDCRDVAQLGHTRAQPRRQDLGKIVGKAQDASGEGIQRNIR